MTARVGRDAVLLLAGLLVLAVAAMPVDPAATSPAERAVFRVVNDAPSMPFPPVWALMQLGMIAVVPAAALIAVAARRPRLGGALLLAGLTAYAGGKLVKRIVERGRPEDLLVDVQLRGTAARGLGFASGHAAVAAALATVLFLHLGTRLRWVVVALAAVVAVLRVYVGAHLPLDVVGGAGLGVAAGGFSRLVVGRPTCS